MEETLTRAIIPDLFNQRVGQETPLAFQVISIREMRGAAGVVGYRLRLSDGQYTNQYIMYIGQRLDALQINCIIQGLKCSVSIGPKLLFSDSMGIEPSSQSYSNYTQSNYTSHCR